MSTTDFSTAAESTKRTLESFLSTLAGLATTWASHGLKIGKLALEQSAEALGKTAKAFDALAAELDKKIAAAAPAGDTAVDAAAPKVDGSNTAPAT